MKCCHGNTKCKNEKEKEKKTQNFKIWKKAAPVLYWDCALTVQDPFFPLLPQGVTKAYSLLFVWLVDCLFLFIS